MRQGLGEDENKHCAKCFHRACIQNDEISDAVICEVEYDSFQDLDESANLQEVVQQLMCLVLAQSRSMPMVMMKSLFVLTQTITHRICYSSRNLQIR